jgi:hypothetical protein
MHKKLTTREIIAVMWADNLMTEEYPEIMEDNYRQAEFVQKVRKEANKYLEKKVK